MSAYHSNFNDSNPPLVLVFARSGIHFSFLKEHLKDHYDLVEATSEQACIEMLSNLTIDLLIFDEKVVEDDPKDFIQYVLTLEGYEKLPILMISRTLKKQYILSMKEAGLTQILRDPLEKQEVLKAVKQCDSRDQIKQKVSLIAARIPHPKRDLELDFKHRYLLNNAASQKIKEMLKEKQAISILMLELDQFHETAKKMIEGVSLQVLDQVEAEIHQKLRTQDVLISLGGGKFMVLMPKTSLAAAKLLAEEIQTSVEMKPFHSGKEFFQLSMSIGIASKTFEELEDTSEAIEQLNRLVNVAKGNAIESKHSGGQIVGENS